MLELRENASETAKARHKILDWHAQSYADRQARQHNLTHTALGLSHTPQVHHTLTSLVHNLRCEYVGLSWATAEG